MLRRRLLSISSLASASLLNAAALAISGLVVADLVTVAEYGGVRTISAYAVVLSILAGLTLHDAVASYVRRGHETTHSTTVSTGLALSLAVSASVCLIAGLTAAIIEPFPRQVLHAALIVLAFAPCMILTSVLTSSMQVVSTVREFAIVTISSGLMGLVAMVLGAWLGGVTGWAIGRGLSWALVLGIAWYIFSQRCSISLRVDSSSAKALFAFARVQVLSGALSLVVLTADIIVLERIKGLVVAGEYGLAVVIARSGSFVAIAISRSYFKRLSADQPRLLYEFWAVSSLCGLLLAVMLYATSDILITSIYAGNYSETPSLIKVLAVGVPFAFLAHAVSTINIALGTPRRSLKLSALSAGTTLVGLIVLIPLSGAHGAAVAVTGAQIVTALAGCFMTSPRAIHSV